MGGGDKNAFLIRKFQAKPSNLIFQGNPEITSHSQLLMLLIYNASPDVQKPTLFSSFNPVTNID